MITSYILWIDLINHSEATNTIYMIFQLGQIKSHLFSENIKNIFCEFIKKKIVMSLKSTLTDITAVCAKF